MFTRDWEISEVQTQFVADHLDQLTSLLLEEIRLTDLQETGKALRLELKIS